MDAHLKDALSRYTGIASERLAPVVDERHGLVLLTGLQSIHYIPSYELCSGIHISYMPRNGLSRRAA